MLVIGGDQPFVRRLIGVSTSPLVGSIYSMGVWDRVAAAWVNVATRRTLDREKTRCTASAFSLGRSTRRVLMSVTWSRPMAIQQWRMHRKTTHRITTMCGSPMHPPVSKLRPISL